MKYSIIYCLVLCGICLGMKVQGANPIIKDKGISDPHIRVFNDKVYLYCGHDQTPDDKNWDMRKWQTWSSTNLVDWTFENYILPRDNYMGAGSRDCWAGDAETRNDKYYFYFSDRHHSVGVMTSDSPTGPFKDPLGEPLVKPMHDPTIFIDDDEDRTPYLVYGHKEISYRIVRLKDDMISQAEEPRNIEVSGREWDQAPDWMDKSYLFKHDGRYYLSWGRDYAVSDNVYGPYECVGSVGQGHRLDEFAHGSFFEWNGQFYHIWCYYIKPMGKYYYKYRESIMTYCHFTDDGKIVTDTDFLDQHFETGVGNYDASWPKIEAEWFYGKSTGVKKQECKDSGFEVSGQGVKEWIHFPKVHSKMNIEQIAVRVSNPGKETELLVFSDKPDGPLLGKLTVPQTKGYQVIRSPLKIPAGSHDLYIRTPSSTLRLDWFRFNGE